MATGRRALLGDDDDDDHDDEEEADNGASLELGYNANYARRFEYNKKREDLHRLQELQKNGLEDESDSEDDDEDDDGLLPARTDEKIFETLSKIRRRDPAIYSAETKFFEDGEDADDDGGALIVKKQRPLYLKDVNARQLLDGTTGEGEQGEEERRTSKKPAPSYFSEQDELKRAFLEGVREAEGVAEDAAAEDVLRVKKRSKEELERDARETEEAVEEAEQRAQDKGVAKRLEEYFGKDDDLDENDRFLKGYLLNKGWIDDQQSPNYPSFSGHLTGDEDISEDEIALEEQDKFEKDYNFRFQEGDINYVKGHSRVIEDSVRKKPDVRRKQRERKKERESEEDLARREELKRLKNLKKNEVMEKLSKIRGVAGVNSTEDPGAQFLAEDDFEEDFDPDEYDKKMKEAFGEEYYGADDPDFVEGDNSHDVELLGVTAQEANSSAGFAAIQAKLDPFLSAMGDRPVTKKSKKIKVPSNEKLVIDKHLEAYYKLDYEDVIGDLPTRFKYTNVKPNKYGLRNKDIIHLDDKDLNQFISLKKLAPYATEEWVPRRPAPRLSSKQRMKKVSNTHDNTRNQTKAADAKGLLYSEETLRTSGNGKTANDEDRGRAEGKEIGSGGISVVETIEVEKKKKRKRKKQIEPRLLPMSRLLSYSLQPKKKGVDGTPKKKKVKR